MATRIDATLFSIYSGRHCSASLAAHSHCTRYFRTVSTKLPNPGVAWSPQSCSPDVRHLRRRAGPTVVLHSSGASPVKRTAFQLVCAHISPALADAVRSLGTALRSELGGQISACALDWLLALVLSCFCGYNVALVLRNVFTLEYDPQYDLGYAANWRQLFGARRAAWLLPIETVDAGDGIHFPRGRRARGRTVDVGDDMA